MYFLKPLSREIQDRYAANIKLALKAMKESAEKGVNPRVAHVAVTDGCNHGCKFCFFNAVPLSKGRFITLDTILLASEKLGLAGALGLTGGEPLDHPQIVGLVNSFGVHIPSTNGFSSLDSLADCKQRLEAVYKRINGISFGSQEDNPGRLLVLKTLLLHGRTPEIWLITELGEEEKLLRGWLKTLKALLQDEEFRTALADPKVLLAFMKLYGLAMNSELRLSVTERSGRGVNLNGLNVRSLSVNQLVFERGVRDAIHHTFLLPNGDLVPNLFYFFMAREPKPDVFANVNDPVEAINAGLQNSILRFLEEKLARNDSVVRAEAIAHVENCDVRITSFMFFCSLLKTPAIRLLFKEIKDDLAQAIRSPSSSFTTFADVTDASLDAMMTAQKIADFRAKELWHLELDPGVSR